MITLVVPTRNRAHTLRRVAPSYFEQDLVTEIIFVNDAGDDETTEVVHGISALSPHIALVVIENAERQGASRSRNIGVDRASNDYILFVDDDEYLEAGYARVCLAKLRADPSLGAVSGRRVYMMDGETPGEALARFGTGLRGGPTFRPILCEYVNGARFTGDIHQPITNAVILTRRDLLLKHPFDGFYARGNGYREETDFQMQIFTLGYRIGVTNDVHSMHLPASQTRHGGQRVRKWDRIYWSIYYTKYFYDKFFTAYARQINLRCPKNVSLALFSCFVVYRELLRPSLHAWAMTVLARQRVISRPRQI
ncbi:glycosyltransferase family 2 protein [Methylobacterium segetis]|uniref:glycosyltransferase family 2 protein n=1 Tax=Methylobacterium segetis TaxID=2488750 RepID=UPI00104C66B5|nr:glycosyltransferase family 2 protein [Methylobacterium segetis]